MSVTIDGPADFPALYRSADRESERAQRSYLRSLRVRLGALLVAAFGGALTLIPRLAFRLVAVWPFSPSLALGAELFLARQPAHNMVRGPCRSGVCQDARLAIHGARRARATPLASTSTPCPDPLAAARPSVDLIGDSRTGAHQISDKMRQVRALDFNERRQVYLTDWIADQQRWYSEKARWNDRRARGWVLVSIVLEISGLIGGALKAFGWISLTCGFLAASAAGVMAWIEAKQHRNLATAYGIASQELASIATELPTLNSEQRWAAFVGRRGDLPRAHSVACFPGTVRSLQTQRRLNKGRPARLGLEWVIVDLAEISNRRRRPDS